MNQLAEMRKSRATKSMILQLSMIVVFGIHLAEAFTTTPSIVFPSNPRGASSSLDYSKDSNSENNDGFDLETLDARIGKIRWQILEDDLQRPPNVSLSPKEFVEALLDGIFHNEDPRPDAGFMMLLRCSTQKWASSVLRSIGAPEEYADLKHADLDAVAATLGSAMSRPNQFAILTGEDENGKNGSGSNERSFDILFPGETLDFLDGTAWINVELRSKTDNSLLVLMGWQLAQRPDGAWLVDQIDWQDYREEFRPGIGREEWQGTYEGRRR